MSTGYLGLETILEYRVEEEGKNVCACVHRNIGIIERKKIEGKTQLQDKWYL